MRVFQYSGDAGLVHLDPRWSQAVRRFVVAGIEHILGGVDHLLFVLALLLLVRGVRRLVATVTAFTVAHSLTLGAATLGFVHVPPAPVEAVIALSILFLASELARRRAGGEPDLTERFAKDGTEVMASSPQQFAAHIKNEVTRNARLVKAAGLRDE
mgnify:CR=1 FL=1